MSPGLTHDVLVEVARGWLSRPQVRRKGHLFGGRSACSVVITEMTSGTSETPDAIGWSSNYGNGKSILVECKASLADFKRDRYKHFRRDPEQGMGVERWYMAPKGVIPVDLLPEGWGLIEVAPNKRTRVVVQSKRFDANRGAETALLCSMLRRLDIKNGKHVAVRPYVIPVVESDKVPRATVTITEDML